MLALAANDNEVPVYSDGLCASFNPGIDLGTQFHSSPGDHTLRHIFAYIHPFSDAHS
jgi:hypothetical protein